MEPYVQYFKSYVCYVNVLFLFSSAPAKVPKIVINKLHTLSSPVSIVELNWFQICPSQ